MPTNHILAMDNENELQFGSTASSRLHQYDVALRQIYDELYELNLTQNSYRIIYHADCKYVVPEESGRLDNTIEQVSCEMIDPQDKERFLKFFDIDNARKQFASGRESLIGEFRKLWVDGGYHWSSLTLFPLQAKLSDDEIYLCYIMDIDAQKNALALAEQNEILKQRQEDDERYRIIVEQTGTFVTEWKRESNCYYIDPKITEILEGDYHQKDVLHVWRDCKVIYPEDQPILEQFITDCKAGRNQLEMTLRLKTKQKGFAWFKVSMTCLREENQQIKRVIATINDVDETVRSERTLKYRAEFDTLTGIYNMDAFCHRAKELLQKHPEQTYAVIRMDINRFKFINDIYGMEEGDRLLCYIARKIQECVTKSDAYGRLGSDIFCIMLAYQDQTQLTKLVEHLTAQLDHYGLGYRVVPSFGICTVDEHEVPVSILCDWANLALKTVKGNMIRKWAFYDDKLRAKQLEERIIEDEMQAALAQRQFAVYLQPKHDILSHKVVGAEALVRWNHPREGLLLPGRFIPLFERNGFIVRLDEFVWEETFRTLRHWIEQGWDPFPISVNVSRAHIYNPAFGEKLMQLLEKYQIPSHLIELELTESTFVENPDELYRTMKILQAVGFTFSMDDFGSGYSSLNMLKNAPVNTIKLDREFLNETTATPKGQTVIECTVAMANQLHLKVIAEGVETCAQAAFLLKAGCDVAQGYYFSHPMPIDQFETLAFPDSLCSPISGGRDSINSSNS